MTKNLRILTVVILIVLLSALIWKSPTLFTLPTTTPTSSETSPSPSYTRDISGCFVNWNDTNKYVLNILSNEKDGINAFVGYYNDGFDSSSGEYVGTYENGLLDGIYTFTAEGFDNQRELVFKFVAGKFVAGFGEYEIVDGVELLKSLESVKWLTKYTYSLSNNCDPPK